MGVSTSLLYAVTDSFRSLRENILTILLTSVTLAFSLAIFTLFIIVFTNLNSVIETWGERTHIVVYLRDDVGDRSPGAIKREAAEAPGVAHVKYVSKEEALEELREELKGHESILEGVDVNPLPASLEIKVEEGYRDPEKIRVTVDRLRSMPWAEEVQYGAEWVERFSAFLNFMELSALIVGVFLALATVFIISNTIRLTVYARKEEIGIMRLVGASNLYIKAPFFLEGLVQGLFGGAMALGILFLCRYLIVLKVPRYFAFVVDLPVSTLSLLIILVLSGMVMGVTGTLVSMGRFLR